MILIVCLDNKNGLSFGARRQSMDSAVRQDILKTVGNGVLRMNAYSARQFNGEIKNTEEDFLKNAKSDDFCFLETDDITPYIQSVSGLIVYRWNRDYPSDMRFPLERVIGEGTKRECCEFSGTSHTKITREVYFL